LTAKAKAMPHTEYRTKGVGAHSQMFGNLPEEISSWKNCFFPVAMRYFQDLASPRNFRIARKADNSELWPWIACDAGCTYSRVALMQARWNILFQDFFAEFQGKDPPPLDNW